MTATFLLLALAALGHHSHPAFYDQCTSVTIEGRIDVVQAKPVVDVVQIRGVTSNWSWSRAVVTPQDCKR